MLKLIAHPSAPATRFQTASWVCRTSLGTLTLAGILALTAACQREAESTLPPEKLLDRAWQEFRLEDFDMAERDFNSALAKLGRQAPATPAEEESAKKLRINANYGLGLVASLGHHGDNPERVTKLLQEVIVLSPHSDMAAWAALALAREEYLPVVSTDPEKTDSIKTKYAKVIEVYPGTPAAEEAFVYLQGLNIQSLAPADIRSSIAAIDVFIAEHPKSRFLSSLYGLKSRGYRLVNEHRQSLDFQIKSLEAKERDPTNPWQNDAPQYYAIALAAQYDVGDAATARLYYNKFLAEYPTEQKAFTVKVQLQRLDETETMIRAQLAARAPSATTAPANGGHP